MSPFVPILSDILAQNQEALQCEYSPEVIARLAALCDRLCEVNAHLNLTAIKDPVEIAVKHIADSLSVARFLPQNARVLDVGCGAGFPCLPLAIARPDLTITALDSTAKKLTFVAQTAQICGCENLTTLCARAEELAQSAYRESFDAVCARAVAAMPILAELCIPFVKKGGIWVALKGEKAMQEYQEARRAIDILGAKLQSSTQISLTGCEEAQNHHIFVLQKTTKTPEIYPRNFSQIRKKPL